MKVLDPKVVALLEEQDWPRIIKRLTAYAQNRIRSLYTRLGEDLLPGGQEAKDLAFGAITDVYTGKRSWDPERHPDLTKFLMDVVKSKSGSLVRRKEHTARVFPKEVDGEEGEPIETRIQEAGPDAEEQIILREQVQAVWDCAKGDDDLELVFLELYEGKKSAEIAKDLGLSVEVVYRLVEKLRRRAWRRKTEES